MLEVINGFQDYIVDRDLVTDMCIILDDDWQCNWPRPQRYGVPTFVLNLVSGAKLDFTGYLEAVTDRSSDRIANSWQKTLRCLSLCATRVQVPLSEFLKLCIGLPELKALVAQVCFHVGLAIEGSLARDVNPQPQGKSITPSTSLTQLDWLSKTEKFDSNTDRQLVQYTIASVHATSQHNTLHLASDKAHACGLPLHNTIFSVPSGVAFIAVPQVLLLP